MSVIRPVGANRSGVVGSTGASPVTPAVGARGGAGPRQLSPLPSGVDLVSPLAVPWGFEVAEVVAADATVPDAGRDRDISGIDVGASEVADDSDVIARPAERPSERRVTDAPPVARDQFERAARPGGAAPPALPTRAAPTPAPGSRQAASPFAGLVSPRTSVAPVPDAAPLPPLGSPQPDAAAAGHLFYVRLGDFLSMAGSLANAGSPAPARILTGSMLVASDAQRADLPGVETMATVVLRGNQRAAAEHFAVWLRSSDRILAAAQQNVAALVQQVLRESYLMTTEVLRDYAEKVQFYNELKKKVRELLENARTTRAAWAEQAQTLPPDAIFLGDPPFECRDVDPVTGDVVTATMTEDDVERWKALDEARKRAAPTSPLDELERLNGPTRLSATDAATLDEMLRDKDGGGFLSFGWADSKNDDYVRDHIDELTALIPKMNKDDIARYLPPIINTLTGGNTDEGELQTIFNALSPVQYLFLYAGELDPTTLDNATFNDDVWSGAKLGYGLGVLTSDPVSAGLGGLSMGALTGGLFSDGGGFDGGEMAELDLIGKKAAIAVAEASGGSFSGELTREGAAQLLTRLAAAAQERKNDGGGDQPPAVGDPKAVRSTDELDAHIKGLEERLNSLGDDAQLANVDLQNELQKQQQTLQMMSNISKMLYDTAMAVVRKIGG